MERTIFPHMTDRATERLWNKVQFGLPDGCWEWQGDRTTKGYGQFWLNRGRVYAHRAVWSVIHQREIPSGYQICHTCDNPSCYNPAHLWLGTNADNQRDMDRKGRRKLSVVAGDQHGMAKLTSQDVDDIFSMRQEGMLQSEIAKKKGIHQAHVSDILNGKVWKCRKK